MPDHAWKAFERTAGAAVSRWLTGGRRRDIIARQSLLGRMVERKWSDLAIHPDCPDRWRPAALWFMSTFQVDCKHRKAFRLAGLLCQPNNPFWEWWAKLTHQSATAGGKLRLMVLQHPGAHVLVFGARERVWLVDRLGKGFIGFTTYAVRHCSGGTTSCDGEELTFCQLESFLGAVDPEMLGCPVPDNKTGGVTDEVASGAEGVRQEDTREGGPEGGAAVSVRSKGDVGDGDR